MCSPGDFSLPISLLYERSRGNSRVSIPAPLPFQAPAIDLTSTPTLFPSSGEQEQTQTQEGLVNSFNERELLSLEPVWKGNSAQKTASELRIPRAPRTVAFRRSPGACFSLYAGNTVNYSHSWFLDGSFYHPLRFLPLLVPGFRVWPALIFRSRLAVFS